MAAPIPHPNVRFPPPFLFVAGMLAGLALDRWVVPLSPTRLFGPGSRGVFVVAGWGGVIAGLAVVFWALGTFVRARTSAIPIRPARTLVVDGPYSFSRNPMYVGLTVLYIGLSLLIDTAWPIVLLPPVLGALYVWVIEPEERYLAGAFGLAYLEYQRTVRRWL
jgi:protein-S-isoprenylcysteine O-methyltransferase Ste14